MDLRPPLLAAAGVFLGIALVCCGEKNTKECETTEDCQEGYWCDSTVWECKEVICLPECAGKCCGDDGCGGTCSFNCQTGYFCDQITCKCDSCGCTTDADCFPDRCCKDCICIEKDCTGLECGPDPVCNISCGDCLDCNGEPDPAMCNADGTCQQVCCPGCDGKCCGDDGCGGTCSDECGLQGMICVSATCTCSEPGRIGDPCPYENVHLDKPECNADEDEFCFGIAADMDWLTCPNGTDEECEVFFEPEYNPVCVEGYCGGSLCTKECQRLCDCCPHGSYPRGNRGEPYYCWPGSVDYSGGFCPFSDVNSCFDGCAMGSTCVGSEPSAFFGLCPNGYFWECDDYIPLDFNPDCIDGICGFSLCVEDCVNGVCDQYHEPIEISGRCFCFPIPDPGNEGMPCELGDVNSFWGTCEPGLTCVGLPADGLNGDCPNGIPDCSGIPSSWNPYCGIDTNHCGASFCARECDAGACEAGFIPFDYSGTCYCAPEE